MTNVGLGITVIGLIGVAGAIETDCGWGCSIAIIVVGILVALIGEIRAFEKDMRHDHKEYSAVHYGSSHDASYPSFLRK